VTLTASQDDLPALQVVEGVFDDIDELAAAAVEWDQEYEQLGRGQFHGQLTQLVLGHIHLNRERWSPGVLQRGAAPKGSWVFGLPLKAKGSLHVRRRPAKDGELMTGTSRDDIGFVATGPTDLMIIVLPTTLIDRWMHARRGDDGVDPHLPPRHWAVPGMEMGLRAQKLSRLLNEVLDRSQVEVTADLLKHLESRVSDTILDMIPSAETIEPLHSRGTIARAVLRILRERLNDPPNVTDLCELTGARERTLFLSCVEAFGRPPAQLLLELRLNAVRRALTHPKNGTRVTSAASQFGFTHLGRFSSMYARQFGESPSATLANSLGIRPTGQQALP